MQAYDFKNPLIQKHFVQLRESHNLIFQFASQAVELDKAYVFDPTVRHMMRWPAHIQNMYDLRTMWGVNYNRLMQFCIVSFCAELEFMFKAIFTQYGFATTGSVKGFYQRFDNVISCLDPHVGGFTSVQPAIDTIRTAFQIRHICVHNMGIADQNFVTVTGLGMDGQTYTFTEQEYINMVDAAFTLQKLLDDKLP